MKNFKTTSLIFLSILINNSCGRAGDANTIDANKMIIRISEIGIDPNDVDEYLSILREESEASVRLEPGVISIYPMFQKGQPTEIRILEIYADQKAYESHLQTPHFKLYKSTTAKMVRSLKLIDMEAIDGRTMHRIFKKVVP